MQLDLRNFGSPTFFMFDPDSGIETDEANDVISPTEGLSQAELVDRYSLSRL